MSARFGAEDVLLRVPLDLDESDVTTLISPCLPKRPQQILRPVTIDLRSTCSAALQGCHYRIAGVHSGPKRVPRIS